jgi:hypothetical protein
MISAPVTAVLSTGGPSEPRNFYRIDPNIGPLANLERIYRRPVKGGAPNVFLQAAVEELPDELVAWQRSSHSISRGVCCRSPGDKLFESLRRLCRTEARLEVLIGLDAKRDRSASTTGLPQLSADILTNWCRLTRPVDLRSTITEYCLRRSGRR